MSLFKRWKVESDLVGAGDNLHDLLVTLRATTEYQVVGPGQDVGQRERSVAFGDDGGELLGDAARVTLCRAAASASRGKRGCA